MDVLIFMGGTLFGVGLTLLALLEGIVEVRKEEEEPKP